MDEGTLLFQPCGHNEPIFFKQLLMHHIPGAAISHTVTPGIAYQAYGCQSNSPFGASPVDLNSIFEAGSLSKTLVSYLIYVLEKKGLIEPKTPLLDQLPNDQQRAQLLIELQHPLSRQRAFGVTYEMILSHSAGFKGWRAGKPLLIDREPGKDFFYSGEGYLFLQRFLEIHLGVDIETVFQRFVFAPVGMPHSSFSCPVDVIQKVALGHDALGNVLPKYTQPRPVIAGSLHTCVLDYTKFIVHLLDSDPQSKGYFSWVQSRVQPTPITPIDWCLGWGRYHEGLSELGRYFWHWGDTGGYNCFVVIDIQTKEFATYFTNSQNGFSALDQFLSNYLKNFPCNASNSIKALIKSITSHRPGEERYWFDYDQAESFFDSQQAVVENEAV